jgi:hypothetical protein
MHCRSNEKIAQWGHGMGVSSNFLGEFTFQSRPQVSKMKVNIQIPVRWSNITPCSFLVLLLADVTSTRIERIMKPCRDAAHTQDWAKESATCY